MIEIWNTFCEDISKNKSVNKQNLYDVYSLDGKPILKGAQDLNSLQNGIYIINGKKMLIKK